MNADVSIGADGLARCAWAAHSGPALARYHDDVWGKTTYRDTALFEALTLGVFQVGLSWRVVFGKRDAFRRAFRSFTPTRVAAMTEADVERLVHDASIIRNRAKIQATVENARAMVAASPTLATVARSYATERRRAPTAAEIPTSSPVSQELAARLKAQGYRFLGPTSAYAFMQNVGMVNDHVRGCFCAAGSSS